MESSVFEKLTVLGEGAKYDVSCSSSGHARVNVGKIGSAACGGICHTWTADGRCMSLLKVLQSNDCVYDCKFCVNRRSAEVARRTFEPKELAELTIEFYRRNYIEGLFLSSAVFVSPDHTTERMYECLWLLREVYGFAGYIHAKVVPGVSPELLTQIGLVADRLSVNIEMPTSQSLSILAPQKKPDKIFSSMAQITRTQIEQKTLKSAGNMKRLKPAGYGGDDVRETLTGAGPSEISGSGVKNSIYKEDREYAGDGRDIEDTGAEGHTYRRNVGGHIVSESRRVNWKEKFAPAGQTAQMVIGASPESDRQIVRMSEALYRKFTMKRVYYSAYIPVSSAPELPSLLTPPPLKREHRLYQADWLMRFYGFSAEEILTEDAPNLDYDLDPKVVWALRNIEVFPIEVNTASEAELLRIPGVGNISVKRIMRHRRIQKIRYEDLKKMGVVLKRARFFITVDGRYYGGKEQEPEKLRTLFALEESLGMGPTLSGADVNAQNQLPERLMGKTKTPLDTGEIRKAMGGGEKPQISLFEYSL